MGCDYSPRTRRDLWITVVALVLSSCTASGVMEKEYPADWASVTTNQIQHDCPDLSGTFANISAAAYPQSASAPPSLSDVFTELGKGGDSKAVIEPPGLAGLGTRRRDVTGSWDPIGDAASVSFTQTADSLTVTFATKAGAPTAITFERLTKHPWSHADFVDKYICVQDNGKPLLRLFDEPNVSSTLVWLLKAADGSLIVATVSQEFGVWTPAPPLVIPLWSHSSAWYRYAPLTAKAGATAP